MNRIYTHIFQSQYRKVKRKIILTLYTQTSAYIPSYCFLYISYDTNDENLHKYRELFKSEIISLILMSLMFDSAVISWWEIR